MYPPSHWLLYRPDLLFATSWYLRLGCDTSPVMPSPDTISALLQRAAEIREPADALIFLGHGERETERWGAGELHGRIAGLANYLREEGLRGKPVLVLHPPGPGFVVALCACLCVGVIAVPAPDPIIRSTRTAWRAAT